MKSKLKSALWSVLMCAAAAFVLSPRAVFAELVATPLRGDSRLVQFHFDPDNAYLVLARPKAVTHIQFAPDEVIQSVAAGDTANWEFSPTKDRKNMFVKPRFDDQDTSLTVITDKRTYQFVLRSTGEGRKWYQRVNWLYSQDLVMSSELPEPPAPSRPQPAMASAAAGQADIPNGLRPDSLRFSYQVEGDAPFKPTVVFDDGRFTYLRLPAGLQELPALFAVIEGQDFSLVNFTIKGDYLVAQRLLDEAVLKLGRAEVRVKRAPPKRTFFGFQREAP